MILDRSPGRDISSSAVVLGAAYVDNFCVLGTDKKLIHSCLLQISQAFHNSIGSLTSVWRLTGDEDGGGPFYH